MEQSGQTAGLFVICGPHPEPRGQMFVILLITVLFGEQNPCIVVPSVVCAAAALRPWGRVHSEVTKNTADFTLRRTFSNENIFPISHFPPPRFDLRSPLCFAPLSHLELSSVCISSRRRRRHAGREGQAQRAEEKVEEREREREREAEDGGGRFSRM